MLLPPRTGFVRSVPEELNVFEQLADSPETLARIRAHQRHLERLRSAPPIAPPALARRETLRAIPREEEVPAHLRPWTYSTTSQMSRSNPHRR